MMSLPQMTLAEARAVYAAMRAILDTQESNPGSLSGLWVYPDKIDANIGIGPRVAPVLLSVKIGGDE